MDSPAQPNGVSPLSVVTPITSPIVIAAEEDEDNHDEDEDDGSEEARAAINNVNFVKAHPHSSQGDESKGPGKKRRRESRGAPLFIFPASTSLSRCVNVTLSHLLARHGSRGSD